MDKYLANLISSGADPVLVAKLSGAPDDGQGSDPRTAPAPAPAPDAEAAKPKRSARKR